MLVHKYSNRNGDFLKAIIVFYGSSINCMDFTCTCACISYFNQILGDKQGISNHSLIGDNSGIRYWIDGICGLGLGDCYSATNLIIIKVEIKYDGFFHGSIVTVRVSSLKRESVSLPDRLSIVALTL